MRRIINLFAGATLSLSALQAAAPLSIFNGDLAPADLILISSGNAGATSITPEILLDFLHAIPSDFVPGVTLPPPTPFFSAYPATGAHIDANDYLVIYYGDGANLTGGASVIFFDTATDGFTIPPSFSVIGNGTFPFDFAYLYDHVAAPDGGLTLALLGVSFAGMTFARRALAKR